MARTLLVAVAVALAGCFFAPKTQSGGIEVYEVQWKKALAQVRSPAAVHLDCDPGMLDFTLARIKGKLPQEIWVEGCRQRVLMMRYPTPKSSTWIPYSVDAAMHASNVTAAQAEAKANRRAATIGAIGVAVASQERPHDPTHGSGYVAPDAFHHSTPAYGCSVIGNTATCGNSTCTRVGDYYHCTSR